MKKTLRIVGIGGGTGLPVLLAGLCKESCVDISAIVSVADNGGSSGRLRESFSMPAVGDLRNCMVALASDKSRLADVFQYRFSCGEGLEGHALGNLIVAALFEKTGSLTRAAEIASRLLLTKGRALVATEMPPTLCAMFDDETVVRGESSIAATRKPIRRIWLEPERPPASPGVLEAILSADAVVLAPGSLYTSLIPNLLVAGVADAIRRSPAVKILICNLLTQPGETEGFTASDHLRVVADYVGNDVVEFCVVNSAPARVALPDSGPQFVACDKERIRALGATLIESDLLKLSGEQIRHNPARLGRLVVKIARAQARQTAENEESHNSHGVVLECVT
jgi:uncharacterized cofD-like protein